MHDMLLCLRCTKHCPGSFLQIDIKYSSTNNRLAAGQYSFLLHHCSVLHCISLAAETMHFGFTYAHKYGLCSRLTFPSYHCASASNNNVGSRRELIAPRRRSARDTDMEISADKQRRREMNARAWKISIKPAKLGKIL